MSHELLTKTIAGPAVVKSPSTVKGPHPQYSRTLMASEKMPSFKVAEWLPLISLLASAYLI